MKKRIFYKNTDKDEQFWNIKFLIQYSRIRLILNLILLNISNYDDI